MVEEKYPYKMNNLNTLTMPHFEVVVIRKDVGGYWLSLLMTPSVYSVTLVTLLYNPLPAFLSYSMVLNFH